MEYKINNSQSKNTTGYFRVTTQPCKTCKQGFTYAYKYYDENEKRCSIVATKLENLEKKVINKGLPWFKLDEVNDEVTN